MKCELGLDTTEPESETFIVSVYKGGRIMPHSVERTEPLMLVYDFLATNFRSRSQLRNGVSQHIFHLMNPVPHLRDLTLCLV